MVGERIKALRTIFGLTQEELAKELDISRSSLSLYETGKREPDYELLRKICKYFNVTADYLLNSETKMPSSPANLTEEEIVLLNAYRSGKLKRRKGLLIQNQGDLIIQNALKNTGLLAPDGNLSDKGTKVISDFLTSNAEILKKLIQDK